MSLWQLPAELAAWVVPLTLALDARQHPRFAALLAGLLLAKLSVPGWRRTRQTGGPGREQPTPVPRLP
jgi:hypothetical protein